MLTIKSAFNAYLNGMIDGWDLLEVVQDHGYEGFEVTPDLKLKLRVCEADQAIANSIH